MCPFPTIHKLIGQADNENLRYASIILIGNDSVELVSNIPGKFISRQVDDRVRRNLTSRPVGKCAMTKWHAATIGDDDDG